MQEQRAALAECHSKVHANQHDLAFQQLGGIMVQAASEAGCRNASGSRAHKGPKGKPYFDRECRELRAKFRYALRHNVDSVKVLVRCFSSVIRRKCRQYRQQQTPILLRHLRSNHKVFWQKLDAQDSVLPESLSTQAAWAAFHQNLCAPPETPIQPDPPQPTQAAPPVDGLEATITQAEVEKALSKLSNGKATGRAGWPAELLRHAAYHVTLDKVQGQSLDACSHSCQLPQRLLQSGSAASLRQLCFGHPNTQKGTRR